MTPSPSFPLLEHPAFRGVSKSSVSTLERGCKVLRFELGAQLCDPNALPAWILVILRGKARLIGRHKGRLTTVGKFGPGSVIGAASLLSGAPCENVIAAEELIAYAIPDELWRDLYFHEVSFLERAIAPDQAQAVNKIALRTETTDRSKHLSILD